MNERDRERDQAQEQQRKDDRLLVAERPGKKTGDNYRNTISRRQEYKDAACLGVADNELILQKR